MFRSLSIRFSSSSSHSRGRKIRRRLSLSLRRGYRCKPRANDRANEQPSRQKPLLLLDLTGLGVSAIRGSKRKSSNTHKHPLLSVLCLRIRKKRLVPVSTMHVFARLLQCTRFSTLFHREGIAATVSDVFRWSCTYIYAYITGNV